MKKYFPWMFTLLFFGTTVALGYLAWDRNRVAYVADGDTIDLVGGSRVRLLGVDAPEVGRCMSEAAVNRLSLLVNRKHVRLKNSMRDKYGRVLADVFVGNIFVNEEIVKQGLARVSHSGNQYDTVLLQAQKYAESQKLGIFSPQCRSSVPPPSKSIKGNLRSGQKYYYTENCPYYGQVIVDTAYGDQWFGLEEEATSAGYVLAPTCN